MKPHADAKTGRQVFQMATEHGAQTTGFADNIGTLEPGKEYRKFLIPLDFVVGGMIA